MLKPDVILDVYQIRLIFLYILLVFEEPCFEVALSYVPSLGTVLDGFFGGRKGIVAILLTSQTSETLKFLRSHTLFPIALR